MLNQFKVPKEFSFYNKSFNDTNFFTIDEARNLHVMGPFFSPYGETAWFSLVRLMPSAPSTEVHVIYYVLSINKYNHTIKKAIALYGPNDFASIVLSDELPFIVERLTKFMILFMPSLGTTPKEHVICMDTSTKRQLEFYPPSFKKFKSIR